VNCRKQNACRGGPCGGGDEHWNCVCAARLQRRLLPRWRRLRLQQPTDGDPGGGRPLSCRRHGHDQPFFGRRRKWCSRLLCCCRRCCGRHGKVEEPPLHPTAPVGSIRAFKPPPRPTWHDCNRGQWLVIGDGDPAASSGDIRGGGGAQAGHGRRSGGGNGERRGAGLRPVGL